MTDTPSAVSTRLLRETLAEGQILRVTLDLGKGNIIDIDAIDELRQLAQELLAEKHLKTIVLDHTGDHFSFGASVDDHLPGRVEEMLPKFHNLARELLAIDLPILAAVRGQCLGGGLEMVLLADRIFASPAAQFGQPEIKLSVFAPLASLLLPRRIGQADATDLLLSGRSLAASGAQAIGLVDQLDGDPSIAAVQWAEEHLLPKSAAAIRLATHAGRLSWTGRFSRHLDRLEQLYLGQLMETEDALEGLQAFLERREPVWQDR